MFVGDRYLNTVNPKQEAPRYMQSGGSLIDDKVFTEVMQAVYKIGVSTAVMFYEFILV